MSPFNPDKDEGDRNCGRSQYFRKRILSAGFEIIVGSLISFNLLCIALHSQWKGYFVGHQLGARAGHSQWPMVEHTFETFNKAFTAIFVIELLARMWAINRRAFFKHAINAIDACIVVVTFIETFVLQPTQKRNGNIKLGVLRVMRAFHLFRILKIVVMAEHISEMRVLVRTLLLSIRGAMWSIVLITGIMMTGAIIMVQCSFLYVEDESIDIETRLWLFQNFGTVTQSFYTMFECTFTGGWRFYSRPMIEDVSSNFAMFWVPYVFLVNFVVMRVVAAIFLRQTLAVADVDKERLAMETMKEKNFFAKELRGIFAEADTSCDGAICKAEFECMMENVNVCRTFEKLGLDTDEVVALFDVLSDDDGEADYEEFLSGALKMKTSARAIDAVQIMHQQLMMRRALVDINEAFRRLTHTRA